MPISAESALAALEKVLDPELGRPISALGIVDDLTVEERRGAGRPSTSHIPGGRGLRRARVEPASGAALRAAAATGVELGSPPLTPHRATSSPTTPAPG